MTTVFQSIFIKYYMWPKMFEVVNQNLLITKQKNIRNILSSVASHVSLDDNLFYSQLTKVIFVCFYQTIITLSS